MLRAAIYLPEGGDIRRWERTCLAWCSSHDYRVVSLVRDNREQTLWPEVVRMMMGGQVDVVVVASQRHVPMNATPRVEAASRRDADAYRRPQPPP